MEFSYLVTHASLNRQEDPHEVFLDAMEQAEIVDQAGFDIVWFPEHHFVRLLSIPSPILGVLAALPRVKRARIGTSVILAPLHHPLTLAGEIAYADHATDGRLEIGFARGSSEYEVNRYGFSSIEAAERTRECVDAVMGLLANENFAFEGKYWRFPETTIVPRPYQKPMPKVWIAARSPETVKWTIEQHLGMMLTVQQEPLKRLRAQVGLVDALVDDLEDHPRPPLSISRMTYVTRDRADALRAMEYVAKGRGMGFNLRHDSGRGMAGGLPDSDAAPEGVYIGPEELADRLVVGDPETVVEKLKAIEAMGTDQFVVYMDFGQPQEMIRRSLDLLATEVLPHFQSSSPAVVEERRETVPSVV